MIDTDTRQLRRTATGSYAAGNGKRPCDHCGLTAVCSVKAVMNVLTCNWFMPAIPFTDDTGMRRLFNTVRIGKAWPQRVDVGQRIALYNTKTKLIFGHARVVGSFVGPILEILRDHAHANHLMLETEVQDAADKLFNWQRQNYGPRIVHEATTLTALYLLRDDRAPVEADLGQQEAGRLVEGCTASPG